ncbi:MAG: alpha/beta hydrolase [Bacteroidota bacterium]
MRLFKIVGLWLLGLPALGQGEYLTLRDSAKVYVEETGNGQTLVFITGWTMTHRFFEHQKSHFSEDFHVLTYDPRGQGRSTQTTFQNHYKAHAEDLREILEQKNLSNVTLIGWSSGCLTVYEYARSFGLEEVDKVVLIDEPPKWVGDINTEWVYGSFGEYRTSLKRMLRGPSDPSGIINWMLSKEVDEETMQWMSDEIRMTPPHVALSLYIDGLVSDYQVDLIKMAQEVPVLAMVRWNFLEEAKAWLDLYAPEVNLKRISSHAMFWERPEEFNALLSDFLRSE